MLQCVFLHIFVFDNHNKFIKRKSSNSLLTAYMYLILNKVALLCPLGVSEFLFFFTMKPWQKEGNKNTFKFIFKSNWKLVPKSKEELQKVAMNTRHCKRKELYGTDPFWFWNKIRAQTNTTDSKKIGEVDADLSNGAMGFFRGYSEARWKAIWVLLRLLGVEYGLFKMKEMAIWRLYEHNDQSWRVLDLNCGTMIIEKWSLLFEDLHKNITFHENWPKRGIMRNCLKFLLSLKYELPNYCCQLKDQNSEQAVGY